MYAIGTIGKYVVIDQNIAFIVNLLNYGTHANVEGYDRNYSERSQSYISSVFFGQKFDAFYFFFKIKNKKKMNENKNMDSAIAGILIIIVS